LPNNDPIRVVNNFLRFKLVTKANERKAAHKAEVNAKKTAEQERRETAEWAVGSKDTSRKDLERARRVCLRLQ